MTAWQSDAAQQNLLTQHQASIGQVLRTARATLFIPYTFGWQCFHAHRTRNSLADANPHSCTFLFWALLRHIASSHYWTRVPGLLKEPTLSTLLQKNSTHGLSSMHLPYSLCSPRGFGSTANSDFFSLEYAWNEKVFNFVSNWRDWGLLIYYGACSILEDWP